MSLPALSEPGVVAIVKAHLANPFSQDVMEPVSIYEARNNLSRLIDAALRGEDVVLTKYGDPVVRIVRIEPAHTGASIAEWLERNRPWERLGRTHEEIEAQIRENREMGE